MLATAKQDFAKSKSPDAVLIGKLRGNTCASNQSQARGVWEMKSMNASTQGRVPSGGGGLICVSDIISMGINPRP